MCAFLPVKRHCCRQYSQCQFLLCLYVRDTKGKKLFEVEEAEDLSGLGGYQNGVMVYKNSLYDKSFNVIATPDESGYDRVEYQSESNIIVSKYKQYMK